MVEQMLALRLVNVSHEAELLICLRTPSYLLQHPNKVVWFLHHHRPAYDLVDGPCRPAGPHRSGPTAAGDLRVRPARAR